MSIKIILLIMIVAVITIIFVGKQMKKLPPSVLNFIGVMAVIILISLGLIYLKKKLTKDYTWN